MKTIHHSNWFLIPLSIFVFFGQIKAQKIVETKEVFENIRADSTLGLEVGVGVGLDFSSLSLINPRPNEGQSQVGFGGLLNIYANYTGKKVIFDNHFNFAIDVDKELDKVMDDDMIKYLETNGENIDAVSVASNTLNENDLPSQDDYLNDDKALDNYLDNINSGNLKN